MSFPDLNLKHSYNSEKNDLLHEFYIPVLSQTVNYRRITGYFSSSSFGVAAGGLIGLIKNRGRMQFIMNVHLSSDDYNAIEQGLSSPEKIIGTQITKNFEELQDKIAQNHAKILGWLIANKILEVKIGYIPCRQVGHDILHQKVGIMEDRDGKILSFSGSNNESAQGWQFNSEKFKVFFSWEGNETFIRDDIADFEELWENRAQKTRVIPFPAAAREHLISIAPQDTQDLENILEEVTGMELGKNPSPQSDKEIQFREYQTQAIDAWFENKGCGIFEMATGTGKTFTALGALKRLLDVEKKLLVIVTCPYLHLCKQWEESIKSMGINLPILYASSVDLKWYEKIQNKILDQSLGKCSQFLILTTHKTVPSEKFMDLMKESRASICIIGDEIHGMGTEDRLEGLLPIYNYRLGLSATPERYMDEEGTEGLMNYFGGVVFEFDLGRAINEINPDTGESYLVPYEYYPIFVELDDDEIIRYEKLSQQIAVLYWKQNKSEEERRILEHKLRERQIILKNANTKYGAFEKLIEELKHAGEIKHTLVYCSPQQIEEAQRIISHHKGIVQHRFTSKEDAVRKEPKYNNKTEREYLLSLFDRGDYDILVAIRCLDEGVDVPSTRTAILLSSSGNPKEYIQRRGRVLRRFPGKEKAAIYDITALPNPLDVRVNQSTEKKIIETQLKRLEEFSKDAMNRSEVSRKIFELKQKYDL